MIRIIGIAFTFATITALCGEPGGGAKPKSTQELLRLLNSDGVDARMDALDELRRRSTTDPSIVRAMMAGFEDVDPSVRKGTIKDLSWFGANAAAAIPRIIQLLNDKDIDVAREAAFEFKKFDPDHAGKSTDAIPVLL